MGSFRELVLELADWCPQKCVHCSSDSGPTRTETLERRTAFALIDEAAELGAEKVSFGGGEPTAATAFGAVLGHVQSHGLQSEVFTCGVWLEGREAQALPARLLEEIRDLGNTKLIFSVHGPTAETHELLTNVPDSFRLMTTSLDAAVQHRIPCEVNFVPVQPNAHLLADVIRYADRHGASRMSILRFVPQGRGWRNRTVLRLSMSEESRFLDEVARYRASGRLQVRVGSPFNGTIVGDEIPCSAGLSKLVVQASGNILPCEVFKHDGRCDWGISAYHHSLREALASPRVVKLRTSVNRSYCMRCPIHGSQLGREWGAADGPEHASELPHASAPR